MQVRLKVLLPIIARITSSDPIELFWPIQSPDAAQEDALTEDQVRVIFESSEADADVEEKDIVGRGTGEFGAPPPQEDTKKNNIDIRKRFFLIML